MPQENSVSELNYGRKVWDFMKWSYWAFGISGLLLVLSIIIIGMKGFNWGLDFTGGTMIEITLEKSVDIDQIRRSLQQSVFGEILLQSFDSNKNIVIRTPLSTLDTTSQELSNIIINIIKEKTNQNAIVRRIESVGPNVGKDLIQTGTIALLITLIFVFIYASFRFEWRLSIGIVIALVHDIVITMGMLSLFYIKVDLTTVASLLSVISYSLNDSIVVSDRIRENFCKIRYGSPYEIFNISLTQILHRTLITSVTILIAIIILYVLGGQILKDFSLTMLIGVFIGTISSIYIASSLALKLGIKREHLLQRL